MAADGEALIREFYAAFARHDGAAMASLYAPDAEFSDPVFTDLRGDEPGLMWRMLTDGAEPIGSTPAAFQKHLAMEMAKWRKVVKSAGVTVE